MIKLIKFAVLIVTISLTACSGKTRYDVSVDKETGIIYNEDWDEVFDEKTAYYNESAGLLNIRTGPGSDYRVVAYMKPQEGGFIRNCSFDLKWCMIDFGGQPKSGWVDMRFLTEGEIEYKP